MLPQHTLLENTAYVTYIYTHTARQYTVYKPALKYQLKFNGENANQYNN